MRFIEHPGENIWDTECEAIVVTVNCVGVMGKGIAKECKERYPEIYERYRQQCEDGQWRPGMISRMVTRDGKDIILAATKDHWRYKSRPEWVRECLQKLIWSFDHLYAYTYRSIALPPLGCGNGGLDINWFRSLADDWDMALPLHLYYHE